MITKLSINRINIHKARKIEISIQHKKDAAELIAKGKQDQARVMVCASVQNTLISL